MEITFVRHAESVANIEGLWQGHGDSPLSPAGRRQAEALGRRLGAERFDVAVCSDLSRAAETARAIGCPVELEPLWREVDVGLWEGLTRAQVVERFAHEVAALRAGQIIKIGGGESWDDAHLRAHAAFVKLRGRLVIGQRGLVVSHGGVLSGLIAALLGTTVGPASAGEGLRPAAPSRLLGRLLNTSVSTLALGDGPAELVRYNDSSHVQGDPDWLRGRLAKGDSVVALVADDAGASDAATALEELVARSAGTTPDLAARPSAIAAFVSDLLGGRPARAPAAGTITRIAAAGAHRVLVDYNCGR